MSEFFDALIDDHTAFIARQPVFFVATATEGARINLSPKGMDAFRVLNSTKVGYLDVGGSGNETHAHLTADGRIGTHYVTREYWSGAGATGNKLASSTVLGDVPVP